MPYAILEDRIAEVAPQYRGELLAFIDFLLFKQKHASNALEANVPGTRSRRRAGGLEGEFYMAPDFDEPLECFKEYM